MAVYLVYRDLYVDGLDVNSLKIFQNKRDAVCYGISLETNNNYNNGYFSVQILEQEII